MDGQTDLGFTTEIPFSPHVDLSVVAGGIQHVLIANV